MKRLAILCALALAGCASTAPLEPRVEVRTVTVAVPTPCNVNVPAQPTYPDADLSNVTDIFVGTQRLLAGRALRTAYIAEILAALNACRSP